jgi:hypothetical protein
MKEAFHLSSKRQWASEEFLLRDDNSMVKALFRKVMQEDTTWDALHCLDQMKDLKHGFDY